MPTALSTAGDALLRVLPNIRAPQKDLRELADQVTAAAEREEHCLQQLAIRPAQEAAGEGLQAKGAAREDPQSHRGHCAAREEERPPDTELY